LLTLYDHVYGEFLADFAPGFFRKKRLPYQSLGCSTIRNLEKKKV
jgi:hypothetical protein